MRLGEGERGQPRLPRVARVVSVRLTRPCRRTCVRAPDHVRSSPACARDGVEGDADRAGSVAGQEQRAGVEEPRDVLRSPRHQALLGEGARHLGIVAQQEGKRGRVALVVGIRAEAEAAAGVALDAPAGARRGWWRSWSGTGRARTGRSGRCRRRGRPYRQRLDARRALGVVAAERSRPRAPTSGARCSRRGPRCRPRCAAAPAGRRSGRRRRSRVDAQPGPQPPRPGEIGERPLRDGRWTAPGARTAGGATRTWTRFAGVS